MTDSDVETPPPSPDNDAEWGGCNAPTKSKKSTRAVDFQQGTVKVDLSSVGNVANR